MPVSMTVTWAPSTHLNQITYQLQYRPVGSGVWINAQSRPSPATSAVVTGLTVGTLYEFRHIASNSPLWSEISVPTKLRAGVPPNAPTHLKVT